MDLTGYPGDEKAVPLLHDEKPIALVGQTRPLRIRHSQVSRTLWRLRPPVSRVKARRNASADDANLLLGWERSYGLSTSWLPIRCHYFLYSLLLEDASKIVKSAVLAVELCPGGQS